MAVTVAAAILSKPLWLVCVLGFVAAMGFYGMLAPLLRWWPWFHDGQGKAAEATMGTIAAGHSISAGGDISAATSIEAGHGIRAGGSIHSGTSGDLADWLGRQINELSGLLTTLEGLLDAESFDYERARPIHEYFWQIRDEVDRKLHTSASEWVDYFNEGHISDGAGLFYPQADLLRSQFVPAIESTIDRIAQIKVRL